MRHALYGFLLLLFCITACHVYGQHTERYTAISDSLRIGPGKSDWLPYHEKGYTVILPPTKQITAWVISLEDRRVNFADSIEASWKDAALQKGLGLLYISTGMPLDLFFEPQAFQYIDSVVADVILRSINIDKPVFFLGVNLAGHRALKYIRYMQENPRAPKLPVRGVMLCEGVLDWVRQWHEGKKAIRDRFAESAVFEGKLVTYLLEKHLGGTPYNKLEAYLHFSPYSYFDDRNRHLKYYSGLAFRAYTEPATYYWMETKRKTTLDTNFPDHVGIINELKLAGNTHASLHIFYQDPTNMDRRNPAYTWRLVNKAELAAWMVRMMQ